MPGIAPSGISIWVGPNSSSWGGGGGVGVRRLPALGEGAENLDLPLEPGKQIVARSRELLQRRTEEAAGAERRGSSVRTAGVAEEPAGIGRPRQDAEGRRPGVQHKFPCARHRGYANTAAGSESREHRPVGRILQE